MKTILSLLFFCIICSTDVQASPFTGYSSHTEQVYVSPVRNAQGRIITPGYFINTSTTGTTTPKLQAIKTTSYNLGAKKFKNKYTLLLLIAYPAAYGILEFRYYPTGTALIRLHITY